MSLKRSRTHGTRYGLEKAPSDFEMDAADRV